jgi:hypothetical protein
MRLYLNGKCTRVRKVVGERDKFEIIIESGSDERTLIGFGGVGLEKLFAQIDYMLKEAKT